MQSKAVFTSFKYQAFQCGKAFHTFRRVYSCDVVLCLLKPKEIKIAYKENIGGNLRSALY